MRYFEFIDNALNLFGVHKNHYGDGISKTFDVPLTLSEGVFDGVFIHIDDDDDCKGRIVSGLKKNSCSDVVRLYDVSEQSLEVLYNELEKLAQ